MSAFKGWGGAALVTGATSGIGLEIARLLARRRMNLVLAARSADKLKSLCTELAREHDITALPCAVDLATREGPDELIRKIDESEQVIDLVVNNAGFGIYGPLGARGQAREREMLELNVSTPTILTSHLLPGMIQRGHGVILNVASTAGFTPMPGIGTYAATKAYLISWTLSLDVELRGSGVRASVLCPGSTATNFHAVAGARKRRRTFPPQQTALQVAEECLRGIDNAKTVIVCGTFNRLQVAVLTLLPPRFAARLAGRAIGQRVPGH